MPEFEKNPEGVIVGEEIHPNLRRNRFLPWILVLLVLVGMVLVIWFLFPKGGEVREVAEESSETLFENPPMETALAFANELDPKERLKWVREADVVSRHLTHYLPQALNEEVVSVTPMGLIHGLEFPQRQFVAHFENGDRRLICVVPTEDGDKVDWDAFARYGTVGWEDLLKGRGGSSLVRVFVKRDRYYNHRFSDDERWSCYGLTSPDFEGVLYGYAEKGSVTDRILEQGFSGKRKKGSRRMSLRIEIVPGDMENLMVEIGKVAANGWVVGEKDFERIWESVSK